MIVLIIFGIFYFGMFDFNKTGIEGTVIKRPYDWGIKSSLWYNPGNLMVKNLPREFQQEGIKLKCDVVIVDVIGPDEWDIYAEVNNCKSQ